MKIDSIDSNHHETGTRKSRLGVVASVLVIFVLGVWALFGWWLPNPDNADHFSAVNALFAGLAFIGLIYAILLQSQELSLQRKELELTRMELEGQKLQLSLQNQTLSKQNLENTFFQLLNFHTDIVRAIDLVEHGRVTARGRDCFPTFLAQLRSDYINTKREFSAMSELGWIEKSYNRFFTRNQGDVGHYFRNLYHIFKFIKESAIDDKEFYASLVVAQLSSHELALLFYNGLSSFGKMRFKPLIEEFAVLENLNKSLIINIQESHLDLYEPSAYGIRKLAANGG